MLCIAYWALSGVVRDLLNYVVLFAFCFAFLLERRTQCFILYVEHSCCSMLRNLESVIVIIYIMLIVKTVFASGTIVRIHRGGNAPS